MGRKQNAMKEYLQRRQAATQAKLKKDFLPEALEIVEKPPPPIGHFVIVVTTIVIVLFLMWSILGRIDEVAIARGRISTISGVQTIQPVNGGKVSEICVKEGDRVAAGQPVVVLDSAIEQITLRNTAEGISSLELETELLNKIQKGESIDSYQSEETNTSEWQIIKSAVALQQSYITQKDELQGTAKQLLLQIAIEEETLRKLSENKQYLLDEKERLTVLSDVKGPETEELEKTLKLIKTKEIEYSDYLSLYEAGIIALAELKSFELELEQLKENYEVQQARSTYERYDSTARLTNIHREIAATEKDYKNQENAVVLAKQRHAQAEVSLSALEAEFFSSIANRIVENSDKITVQESNLNIQKINFDRQVLTSPVDGVVKTLEIHTVGGVLTPAQIAATVVPDDQQLIAEIDILNKDVGYVEAGQTVAVKLDTFNFQKFGKLQGTVIAVSPDAILDDRKGWIYRAKVALDREEFEELNPEADIGAGMECTAEIKISDRRIIEFFLEPIVERFDGSLKVR